MMQADGRDLHIIKGALALAIVATEGVTDKLRRPGSDIDDMKRLLDQLCPSELELELATRRAGYILNGTDPLPPGLMEQVRRLNEGDGKPA